MKLFPVIAAVLLSLLLTACVSTKMNDSNGLGIQPGFDVVGLTKQQVLQHQAVFFDFNKTDVKPQYITTIELHANYLTKYRGQKVLLIGNTDRRGSREYNVALGEKRADSVADILMANGVLSQQIINVSYGAEVPLACGDTDDAYSLNRRVDILYCQSNNCKQVAKNYGQTICTFPG